MSEGASDNAFYGNGPGPHKWVSEDIREMQFITGKRGLVLGAGLRKRKW